MIRNSVLTGGAYYYNVQNTHHVTINSGPLKALTEAASPSAFHNSGSRYDPPKCHENTRVAVLKKLKDWVIGADRYTRTKRIMWMYGGAGAGKSAIGQTFAEKCDAEGRLLASFFFGRSDATRSNAKFLIPTIACQVYQRVPEAREKILSAIDNDPLIFNKALLIQLEELVIQPLVPLTETLTRNLIIIDGLDECLEKASQTAILRTLFDVQRPNCRIHFLIASRPEHDIVTSFSLQDNAILARLILDDEYGTYEDIRLFLDNKIRAIKATHPFRHLIPQEWPRYDVIWEIVEKSSGQFIYVSTVVKFIESIRHRPDQRLDIVRNLRPAQGDMPFAQLDALYTHILTSAQDISMVVELLSFVLYASRVHLGVTVVFLEEIHNLERRSVGLILCDLGALVVIDEDNRIGVLHASLLDFLLDPSRSKDLPISGDVLMTKHITTCFRFLSKNKISVGTYRIIESTHIAVRFLNQYLGRIPIFTADMAGALDGFSLLKLCHDVSPIYVKHDFLKLVNPVLLRLLWQSDQYQFRSRYLTMMDESFLALMDEYPPYTLALQISIMMHDDVFPRSALEHSLQLPAFRTEDDKLGILCFPNESGDLGPTKAQRSILCEFLLDPSRSQHHDFLRSGPKLYGIALLGCLDYLSKVVIREDCSIDETWLNNYASSMEFSEEMILENKGGNATPDYDYNKIIPQSSTEYSTIDNKQDIKAWQRGWQDCFKPVESMEMRPRHYYCLVELKLCQYKHYDEYCEVMQERYYLMLGYMIYFFPLAGFSQELIRLCKTTVLHRDPRLFPEHTASAQRAMAAYLRRMAETMNNDQNFQTGDVILTDPSALLSTHGESMEHKTQARPDIGVEGLITTSDTTTASGPGPADLSVPSNDIPWSSSPSYPSISPSTSVKENSHNTHGTPGSVPDKPNKYIHTIVESGSDTTYPAALAADIEGMDVQCGASNATVAPVSVVSRYGFNQRVYLFVFLFLSYVISKFLL